MKTNRWILTATFFLLTIIAVAQKGIKNRPTVTGTIYLNLDQANAGPGYIDIPISFTSPDSIIALDFAIKFDESKLTYQSIINVAPYLTDALAYFAQDDRKLRFTSNSMHSYQANAAIASIRFTVLGGIILNTDFTPTLGLLNGKPVNIEVKGNSTLYNGSLNFWLDNSPIRYDGNNPDHYLITNIYGADTNCIKNPVIPVQPNLAGQFSYNILNGSSIQTERDILPATDVQLVINGLDVNLGHKVVLNDTSFSPSVFQLIALDVNADGVVSAGDISQINQRSVKTIAEFKQKWNYGSDGISNGPPSKDWLFIDSELLSSTAYKKSISYPSDDGSGYSKYKVPVVPFCLHVPVAGSITGILLGDTDGNYAIISADGKIK